ncbi:hypothetical protein [Sinorhizobium fredii]|uniref:hypothetical protein n=1 Tax=Rhizobium fredii TaxID=380 RepID=UPI001F15BBD1|nr:hypothetical protein [Sinorhizobium fredii]
MVTIKDDRSIIVEERNTSIAQFERLFVDVSGASDWKELVSQVSTGLERLRSTVTADHLVTRIQLHGSNPLAWRIRRDLDLVRTEMETRGSIIGNVWIDKVQTSWAEPGDDGPSAGALGELSSIIAGDVLSSTAYQQELVSIAEELRGQLPAELRDIFGTDEASFQNIIGEYAHDGSAEVLARLRGGQEE